MEIGKMTVRELLELQIGKEKTEKLLEELENGYKEGKSQDELRIILKEYYLDEPIPILGMLPGRPPEGHHGHHE